MSDDDDFLFNVKWTDTDGTVRYGIYRTMKKGKKGIAIVDDAIMPYYHEVPRESLEKIPFKMGTFDRMTGEETGGDEMRTFVSQEFMKAKAISEAVPEGTVAVGSMFRSQVADGFAFYVVTKIGKRNIEVQWRGFGADHYYDHILGNGGSFPARIIKPLVFHDQAMARLFGKKTA